MSMSVVKARTAAPAPPGYVTVVVTFADFAWKYDTSFDEQPRLLLYTDRPRVDPDGLPYAQVPFGAKAVSVQVPSEPEATRLWAQCAAFTVSPVSRARVLFFQGLASCERGRTRNNLPLLVMPEKAKRGGGGGALPPPAPNGGSR
jgi:hypothetical protein